MKKSYPERKLKELKKKRRKRAAISLILSLLFSLGFLFLFYHPISSIHTWRHLIYAILILASIFLFFSFIYNLKPKKEELILRSGVEGEKSFQKYLDKIKGYKFYSVPLPHGGDIDALLISTKGVFAFEIKNYSGIIECENGLWRRTKIGRGGGQYDAYVGNPSEEAIRHARDLEVYIKNRGFQVKIEPVVVITHPSAKLKNVEFCDVTVIKPEELRRLLKRRDILSKRECEEINKIIRMMK